MFGGDTDDFNPTFLFMNRFKEIISTSLTATSATYTLYGLNMLFQLFTILLLFTISEKQPLSIFLDNDCLRLMYSSVISTVAVPQKLRSK